jgi:Flp pilus assembly protein TadB
MIAPVVASAAAAMAVALLGPARGRLPRAPEPVAPHDEEAVIRRLRPVLVVLIFVGAWTVLEGPTGVVTGAAAAVVGWRVLGRVESPAARRRRAELERDLPTAVHLLGACLEAGAAPTTALETVAAALPGAVADELVLVRHRLALGTDPVTTWRQLAVHPQLGPLGRAMARAHQSGASVRGVVGQLSAELAAQTRARTDALARTVEVRSAAPLGVCFLPAFLLLGVVPMVVGVFSTMRLFG